MRLPGIRGLRRAALCAGRRLLAVLLELVFRIPGYGVTLRGRGPRELLAQSPDPWPGDAARGQAIVGGRFEFAGEVASGDLAAWGGQTGSSWQEQFHAFEWLRDLRALGGDAAHQRARKLVKDWIVRNETWRRPAWRPDIMGRRVSAWISNYDFFAAGADAAFRAQVLTALAHQTRHLSRVVPGALAGAPLLSAIKGLVLASLALPNFPRTRTRTLALLAREMTRQVLPDGGHIERCPSRTRAVLRDLVDLRGALLAAQQPVPEELLNAIDRMAPMLRFFRLGDGGLALFNSGSEGEPWLTDLVLSRAEAKGKPLAAAPHSGFQRLSSGRAIAVFDAGLPALVHCLPEFAECAHAGTLSFEMSDGKERVIVNCGAPPPGASAWRRPARATAAHSTLVVADTNSSQVHDRGLTALPESVLARRTETETEITVEGQHDGYARQFGLIHRRRLAMSAGGEELRGEDVLIAAPRRWRRRKAQPFAIRFHLHPDAKASILKDGRSALIKLASGAGIRLAASGGSVEIEDGVYLGTGDVRKASQIVVSGTASPVSEGEAASVAWTLTRVGPGR